MSPARYRFAGLCFDPADGRLERADGTASTQLRPQVARLLGAFLEQPQSLIERDRLCRAVWDDGVVIDFESGLAAVLRELRTRLGEMDTATDLIETLPRRGYRLNSPVQREAPAAAASAAWSAAGRKRLLGLGAAVLLVLLAGLFAVLRPPEPPPLQAQQRTLAVLPFSQFGAPQQDSRALDLLLADRVLAALAEHQPDGVTLIGRASLLAYGDGDDVAAAVARDLGIDLLIEGSVVFEANQVSISARLLEMPAGRILWSHQIEHPEHSMPPIAELAGVLVEALGREWE